MGARGSGKSIREFRQWCERASELELQIEFAKNFGMPYDEKQAELNKIYNLLDRGSKNETSSKKRKKELW